MIHTDVWCQGNIRSGIRNGKFKGQENQSAGKKKKGSNGTQSRVNEQEVQGIVLFFSVLKHLHEWQSMNIKPWK